MQQRKKANGCAITAVITLVVVVVIGSILIGSVVYVHQQGVKNADATNVALSTALAETPSASSAPTRSQIDALASSKITAAQSSSGIDSNYEPTDSQSSFTIGTKMYITYKAAGDAGYAVTKFYRDGDYDTQSQVLTIHSGSPGGYFSFTMNNPGQFVAAIYWCELSTCSDGSLAQVVNFSAS
jgi:hypothetical protein